MSSLPDRHALPERCRCFLDGLRDLLPSDALPVLRTRRLVLRAPRLADAPVLSALLTPAIAHNLASWPAPMSPEEAALKILGLQQDTDARRAAGYAILREDRPIGWLHAAGPLWEDEPDLALLTYWIAEGHQGQGLLPEALAAALPALARHLVAGGFRRIGAAARPENAPSFRVMERAGLDVEPPPRPYRWRAHGLTIEVRRREAPIGRFLARAAEAA